MFRGNLLAKIIFFNRFKNRYVFVSKSIKTNIHRERTKLIKKKQHFGVKKKVRVCIGVRCKKNYGKTTNTSTTTAPRFV